MLPPFRSQFLWLFRLLYMCYLMVLGAIHRAIKAHLLDKHRDEIFFIGLCVFLEKGRHRHPDGGFIHSLPRKKRAADNNRGAFVHLLWGEIPCQHLNEGLRMRLIGWIGAFVKLVECEGTVGKYLSLWGATHHPRPPGAEVCAGQRIANLQPQRGAGNRQQSPENNVYGREVGFQRPAGAGRKNATLSTGFTASPFHPWLQACAPSGLKTQA